MSGSRILDALATCAALAFAAAATVFAAVVVAAWILAWPAGLLFALWVLARWLGVL